MPGRRQLRKMPSFEGVAEGATATLRMPPTFTYHHLEIEAKWTGNEEPDLVLGEHRLLANNRTLQRWNFNDLLAYLTFNEMPRAPSTAATSIRYKFPMDRPRLRTRMAQERTAIGTGLLADANGNPDPTPIQTLSMEIDVPSNATSSNLALEAIASVSRPSFAGLVKKVRTSTYPLINGTIEISDLVRGDVINSIMIDANTITEARLEVDNYTVWERSSDLNKQMLEDSPYRDYSSNEVTNYFFIDFSEDGFGDDGLVTAGVGDLRLFLTSSAADAGARIVTEYIGPLSI